MILNYKYKNYKNKFVHIIAEELIEVLFEIKLWMNNKKKRNYYQLELLNNIIDKKNML